MAIPTEAIIHSGQRKLVFVTKGDGKFEPREIKTGAESDDGFMQVLSGLFMDDMVVVSGQFLLDSESQTREAIAKMRAAQAQKTMDAPTEGEAEHTHEGEKQATQEMDPEKLYACPMHPEFITTDPEAKCPECGMNLVPVSELEGKVDLENAEFYTCSMHPEFLSTDPDGRCPECGMKLEKVKK